jgi:MFS family permease
MSTSLVFLAPLLVTLALKVNSLVGIERAPNSLAVVTGIGALLAMVGNPFFGRMSDRISSRLGMRRPWMVHRPAVLQRPARRPGFKPSGVERLQADRRAVPARDAVPTA